MSGDFQAIRETVRNGDYLKANILRLRKYRNALRVIQPWESTADGQRQNYEAIREKQKLIQDIQTEIHKRWKKLYSKVGQVVLTILIGVTVFLIGHYLYDRYFDSDKQIKPPTVQSRQKPTTNIPATSNTDKENKSQKKSK